jgi:hypothetical protein
MIHKKEDPLERQRREFTERAAQLREDHDRERVVKGRQRRAIPSRGRYDWNGQGS